MMMMILLVFGINVGVVVVVVNNDENRKSNLFQYTALHFALWYENSRSPVRWSGLLWDSSFLPLLALHTHTYTVTE